MRADELSPCPFTLHRSTARGKRSLASTCSANLGDFAAEEYPAALDAWCRATLHAMGAGVPAFGTTQVGSVSLDFERGNLGGYSPMHSSRPLSLHLMGVLLIAGCRSGFTLAATPASESTHGIAQAAFEDVFVRGVGHRDTAAVVRSLAPELLLHIGTGSIEVPRSQFWAVIQSIVSPFPDISFTVDRVVAEGDWAAAGLTFRGTQRGSWHDIAPTGRPVTVTETFICRLEKAQLRECWQQWDEAGLREQLTRTR